MDFPEGILGRIGVAVSGADSDRVYAIIEAKEGRHLSARMMAARTGTMINDDLRFRQRAWYFSKVYADPQDVDTVYVAEHRAISIRRWRQEFQTPARPHGDNHGLWIDPTNPNRIANVSDGGASISVDGGETWSDTGQSANGAVLSRLGQTTLSPTTSTARNRTTRPSAIASRGDDGVIDARIGSRSAAANAASSCPTRATGTSFTRNTRDTSRATTKSKEQYQDVSSGRSITSGHGAADLKHRFQWIAPIRFRRQRSECCLSSGAKCFQNHRRA